MLSVKIVVLRAPQSCSSLPPVPHGKLVKKHYVSTVCPARKIDEEAEYQRFHVDAAR